MELVVLRTNEPNELKLSDRIPVDHIDIVRMCVCDHVCVCVGICVCRHVCVFMVCTEALS